MADTSSRAFALLSLLQSHRDWSGGELAERLGVSLRTLRRDVDRLRELGYPVAARRGVAGGYRLEAGAALPPLVLDDDEAVALAVGLLAAAHSSVTGVAEASARALGKVVPVMPRRLRRRVEAVTAMTEPAGARTTAEQVDPVRLTTVALACRDSERLRVHYTAADGAQTERSIEPHRLVSLGQRWYLVAYDLARHDWRTLRLDRITAAEPTGARFAPRPLPESDAARMVAAAVGHRRTGIEVEATVAAPAAEVAARIGRWARVEPDGDDACVVRIDAASREWAAFALAITGVPFTVRRPREVATMLAEWGARFVAAGQAP